VPRQVTRDYHALAERLCREHWAAQPAVRLPAGKAYADYDALSKRRSIEGEAYRDEKFIKHLVAAVTAFNDELAAIVERIRGLTEPDQLRRQLLQSLEAAA
jgi:hypothetical protein